MENKFVTFSHKKKKIRLRDFTMKSCSKYLSLKDYKDVSDAILQDNQKSFQKM